VCAVRHIAVAGLGLGHGDAAQFLDRAQPPGAVRTGAGQHDADRVAPLRLGQRTEELVNGVAVTARGRRFGDVQSAVPHGKDGVGLDNVDIIRLHPHAVSRRVDRHLRVQRDQFSHLALAVRRQVHDEHEGHAAVRRHVVEELVEGFQTAGRGAHADDGKAGAGRGDFVRTSRVLRVFYVAGFTMVVIRHVAPPGSI